MKRVVVIVLLLLAGVVGCSRGADRITSNTTINGPITLERCSFIVVIAGQRHSITGTGGSTVSAGGQSYQIAPDCSKVETVTTTTSTSEPEPVL